MQIASSSTLLSWAELPSSSSELQLWLPLQLQLQLQRQRQHRQEHGPAAARSSRCAAQLWTPFFCFCTCFCICICIRICDTFARAHRRIDFPTHSARYCIAASTAYYVLRDKSPWPNSVSTFFRAQAHMPARLPQDCAMKHLV
ncbi:hypothetical protein CMQ_5665 [Grosmannia clavigera kw1407]|uniref:Uncharacterized protein n=1 Tax=Grosmannia clavigera (strain kw1407 / UAMH 11150) TaxID=655863 RepID=F0XSX6_GROCL|nr:uncharacterized protein CMQ_5665 [Grosmannia clavigera kw1407]EFW99244.1 hypothetical protein CMQ_5665 [Grosmannia clavigera kw1407]